jgi:hypothetical protein
MKRTSPRSADPARGRVRSERKAAARLWCEENYQRPDVLAYDPSELTERHPTRWRRVGGFSVATGPGRLP